MTRIFKLSDRIKLRADDVYVLIAPLNLEQKTEVQVKMLQGQNKGDFKMLLEGTILLLKYGVKDIRGLKNLDGSDYQLPMENGMLTDEAVDDIFNIELHKKIVAICSSLVKGVPSEFIDDEGKKIEGVEFISSKKEEPANPN